MSLIVRNDEQIQVGVTTGLVAGQSSFTFDGTNGKPDYRYFEPIFSEYEGRSPMIKGLDYSWNYTTGQFTLLKVGDVFVQGQYYNVHFQPSDVASASTSVLIDSSFFIGGLNIPNISTAVNQRNAPILERLNYYISKYESYCLMNILGYPLYKAVMNENSSRIDELVNGAEYTNVELKKWNGLVYDPKTSLVANFVYVKFQSDSAALSTGVSTSTIATEGGTSVSPADKIIDAWNFFSEEVKQLLFFLWSKNLTDPQVYPEFTREQSRRTLDFARPINVFGI